MDNKKIKYLLIIIISISILVIGGTFSFYTSRVSSINNGNTNISTRDIGSIKYTGVFALNTENFYPGSIGVTKFTIEKDTPTGTGIYEIDIDALVDLAYSDDIEISLYKTTDEENNNVSVTEGNITNTNNQYIKNDTLVINGSPELVYGPEALQTSSLKSLEQADFDCRTLEKTTYYVVYKYKNNGNQNYQQGKVFESEISVRLIDEKTNTNNKNLTTIAYLDGELVATVPTGSNYKVDHITCNNGASATWNYAKRGLFVENLSASNTTCTVYFFTEKVYDDGTGASVPELAKGMIPIYYDGITMKVADTSSKWYNYADHEWANAVLVNVSDSDIKNKYFNDDMSLRNEVKGHTVDMNEVLQMYVWIPRYRYQLWNAENGSSDPQAINIVFEDKGDTKSVGTDNGEWLTHPAFTFGSEELNGIWVGKFENSGSTSNITIKPNMASIANLNVSKMFNASRAVESSSLLGLNANEVDTHMMKDTEWGAVAYLYSSIYGTYNADKSCISRGCEVWINNVSSNGAWDGAKYTGCAAQGVSASIISGTSCESGRGWDGAGVNASTTGNMYGIYDMSGGNWEYTMSVMLQNDGTPQIQSSGFSSMPDSKYYNTYPYGTSELEHSRGTIGTATKETLKTFGSNPGGWNGDYSGLVLSSSAWAVRGGLASDTTAAGVFAFSHASGVASANIGFRLVLALTA